MAADHQAGAGSYAERVLDILRHDVRGVADANLYYPVLIISSWFWRNYVCIVYRYHGRERQYGLCREVVENAQKYDEADAQDSATMIRVGDLEELPPLDGLVTGSDGTEWWGDVGSGTPREVWDRPQSD